MHPTIVMENDITAVAIDCARVPFRTGPEGIEARQTPVTTTSLPTAVPCSIAVCASAIWSNV